ncbi:MAG: hypothetical protein EZS28_024903 [Streblomastix strix]|uniref:SPRY domain-containing protein n=1 Tax=Streblomastix strix TaxID=222440 RepID=A0A5J4VAR3_9EUKA|nr:MAG: hypothetical protein EZS28_024903 [Streblomastix strix]
MNRQNSPERPKQNKVQHHKQIEKPNAPSDKREQNSPPSIPKSKQSAFRQQYATLNPPPFPNMDQIQPKAKAQTLLIQQQIRKTPSPPPIRQIHSLNPMPQIQQQIRGLNLTDIPEEQILQSHQLILPNTHTPIRISFFQGANISVIEQQQTIRNDSYEGAMIVVDKEISSGVWALTVKGKINKSFNGIGVIDADHADIQHPFDTMISGNNSAICYMKDNLFIKGAKKCDLNENEKLNSGDEITAFVDFKRKPRTFSLAIKGITQPRFITDIPNRVKFILIFGYKNDEWQIISLDERNHEVDLSAIEGEQFYQYK